MEIKKFDDSKYCEQQKCCPEPDKDCLTCIVNEAHKFYAGQINRIINDLFHTSSHKVQDKIRLLAGGERNLIKEELQRLEDKIIEEKIQYKNKKRPSQVSICNAKLSLLSAIKYFVSELEQNCKTSDYLISKEMVLKIFYNISGISDMPRAYSRLNALPTYKAEKTDDTGDLQVKRAVEVMLRDEDVHNNAVNKVINIFEQKLEEFNESEGLNFEIIIEDFIREARKTKVGEEHGKAGEGFKEKVQCNDE